MSRTNRDSCSVGLLTDYGDAQSGLARSETKARIAAVRKLLKPSLETAKRSIDKSGMNVKQLAARSQAGSKGGPLELGDEAAVTLQKAVKDSGLGGSRIRTQLLKELGIRPDEWVSEGLLVGRRGMQTVTELPILETSAEEQPAKGKK
jgi:hypothetical protein